MTAPSAAHDDTPMMPGSANGLRSNPCNAAPARPRLAPTRMASSVRGSRSSISTSVASVDSPRTHCAIAAPTSSGARPTASDAAHNSSSQHKSVRAATRSSSTFACVRGDAAATCALICASFAAARSFCAACCKRCTASTSRGPGATPPGRRHADDAIPVVTTHQRRMAQDFVRHRVPDDPQPY